MTLGEKIKYLRKEKNWSQQKLGEEINSAKSVIWKYEKDEAVPSADVLKRIAQVFAISADYLLFDSSERENITRITDKDLLRQFEEIDAMDEKIKEHVRFFLDLTISANRIKKISS